VLVQEIFFNFVETFFKFFGIFNFLTSLSEKGSFLTKGHPVYL